MVVVIKVRMKLMGHASVCQCQCVYVCVFVS